MIYHLSDMYIKLSGKLLIECASGTTSLDVDELWQEHRSAMSALSYLMNPGTLKKNEINTKTPAGGEAQYKDK